MQYTEDFQTKFSVTNIRTNDRLVACDELYWMFHTINFIYTRFHIYTYTFPFSLNSCGCNLWLISIGWFFDEVNIFGWHPGTYQVWRISLFFAYFCHSISYKIWPFYCASGVVDIFTNENGFHRCALCFSKYTHTIYYTAHIEMLVVFSLLLSILNLTSDKIKISAHGGSFM